MLRLARILAYVVAAAGAGVLAVILVYRWVDPPGTPLMILRMAQGDGADYRPVSLAAIAPSLGHAVIAAEDNRFCVHHGVDWTAVDDALDDWDRRGRLRGASTITMQVARNLFLWPGGGFVRKAVEVPLAFVIDAIWPKRRILEVYLQIAELGRGIFGAEATARAHFGKPARSLSVREAALLAAILPNPRQRDPAHPSAALVRRAESIVSRAVGLGTSLACVR
jgi:monofunctional biosynthetic peptidoglycan transglycosylase